MMFVYGGAQQSKTQLPLIAICFMWSDEMELKQLHYFLKVAEHLNFSRAAEALYISQPALSYQIAELERELGLELFTRDRRKVYLTPSGMALVEPAKAMLEQAERLPSIVRQGGDREAGLLRIGFDSTEDHFETIGVTDAVARFGMENPGVELSMIRAPFPECADRVIYGELDLAFLIMRHREHLPPELTSRPVYQNRVVMVVRADSDIQTCAEAVEKLDLLLVGEKPRGNSRILKALGNMKVEPKIRQVDSMPAGFVYAQMGKGIMLLSQVYFEQHRYVGLRALPIPDEAACITHMAVWNRGSNNPMVERLLAQFPEIVE